MPINRMDRDQFFGALAGLDQAQLKKALWNLYWRGSTAMRERVEAEIHPDQADRRARRAETTVDPRLLLDEVREFVALARSGAYLGGDRRVSPRERGRWRFTFRRLAKDAQAALHADGTGDAVLGLEQLIELACQTRDYDYFRSEDPVEAAQFVVSEAAAPMWAKVRDLHGFAAFAERAAAQLIRWESPHGWTRSGWGPLSQRETSLASVLAGMLTVPDQWATFADHYLNALDHTATSPGHRWRSADFEREQRSACLAEWHRLLLDKLIGSDAEDRLDRLTHHPALGGPELDFLRAQLARRRGDLDTARSAVAVGLQRLPGHQEMIQFAVEIGAPLPTRAKEIVKERSI